MRIAERNQKVMFQHCVASADQYENHINTWTDYFNPYATIIKDRKTGNTEAQGVVTFSEEALEITCRYCSELAVVDTEHYRIVHNEENYNIVSIDPNGYNNKDLTFSCVKERR